MSRIPSHEIGMMVSSANWPDFEEQGFRPYTNIADSRSIYTPDAQIAAEGIEAYNRFRDMYGADNIAWGSAFALDSETGEPVFAYADTSPLMGLFVRDLENN